jgi:hypothetical protein
MAHPGAARLLRHGDPTSSLLVSNTKTYIFRDITCKHKPNGAKHLTPADFRMLIAFVVASNSTFLFCLLTMLLMAIEQYLRKGEFSFIHSDCFDQDSFVMTGPYVVKAFHMHVKVKRTSSNEAGKYFSYT